MQHRGHHFRKALAQGFAVTLAMRLAHTVSSLRTAWCSTSNKAAANFLFERVPKPPYRELATAR